MRTLVLIGAIAGAIVAANPVNAKPLHAVPAPHTDLAAGKGTQVAVLAGGCFWDMEGVFKRVKGVVSVTSGYAGGARQTATYAQVMTQLTGHAEVVLIVYDPRQISYGTLLRIYFSVAHDPTTIDAQGPLHGPSYRSAIFAQNIEQRRVAAAYIAQLGKAHAFDKPIVTRIESGQFYPAEAFHQGYCTKNPMDPYVVAWIKPKVAALRTDFPALAVTTANTQSRASDLAPM